MQFVHFSFCFQEAVKESKAALLTPEDGDEVSFSLNLRTQPTHRVFLYLFRHVACLEAYTKNCLVSTLPLL